MYNYRKEVLLKKAGELPAWKTGTANPAQLVEEETRSGHGDGRVFYAHQEDAERGNWSEIVGGSSFKTGTTLTTKKDYVYQFSTLQDGSCPLVVRGGYKYAVKRNQQTWEVTNMGRVNQTVNAQ